MVREKWCPEPTLYFFLPIPSPPFPPPAFGSSPSGFLKSFVRPFPRPPSLTCAPLKPQKKSVTGFHLCIPPLVPVPPVCPAPRFSPRPATSPLSFPSQQTTHARPPPNHQARTQVPYPGWAPGKRDTKRQSRVGKDHPYRPRKCPARFCFFSLFGRWLAPSFRPKQTPIPTRRQKREIALNVSPAPPPIRRTPSPGPVFFVPRPPK